MTCLAWNPCLFDPPQLVVGTGQAEQPVVKVRNTCQPRDLQCTHPPVPRQIWEYNSDERAWRPTIELAHDGPVRCVDWAPKMGRSSHNIATAQGASVKIWELEDSSRPQKEQPSHVLIANAEGEDEAAAAEVWRVKWNITGTVLASSGDDGQVRLWKPDPTSGEWVERAQVTG